MQKILVDTNFILSALKFRVRRQQATRRSKQSQPSHRRWLTARVAYSIGSLFGLPYGTIIIPSAVIHELEKITESKSRDAALARAALQLIEKKGYKILETRGNADKAILNYAIAHKCKVATNDKKLIKALKANGIKIIRIRQKKYVIEE